MKENLFRERKLKSLLSFVLAFAMVITFMPLSQMTVYADNASTDTTATFDFSTSEGQTAVGTIGGESKSKTLVNDAGIINLSIKDDGTAQYAGLNYESNYLSLYGTNSELKLTTDDGYVIKSIKIYLAPIGNMYVGFKSTYNSGVGTDNYTINPDTANGCKYTFAEDHTSELYEYNTGISEFSLSSNSSAASPAISKIVVTYSAVAPSTTTKVSDCNVNVPVNVILSDEEKSKAVTEITSDSTSLTEGWYIVNNEVTIENRITVSGAVNIILSDDAKFTASKGITVTGENSLTIWSQTNDTGILKATGEFQTAGIGGVRNGAGKNITINGGIVTAIGGTSGAGIGGGYYGDGSNITINGGTVTASGGTNGAGIGGGADGTGSNITINGGTVAATGGYEGAGIGGGTKRSGNNITINGGTVTATGGMTATGIGSGRDNSASSKILIDKGVIVKADDAKNPPITIIENNGTELATALSGKRYVTITTSDISKCTITYEKNSLSVKNGTTTLHNLDDYTYTAENNISGNTNNISYTVTGMGSYTSSETKTAKSDYTGTKYEDVYEIIKGKYSVITEGMGLEVELKKNTITLKITNPETGEVVYEGLPFILTKIEQKEDKSIEVSGAWFNLPMDFTATFKPVNGKVNGFECTPIAKDPIQFEKVTYSLTSETATHGSFSVKSGDSAVTSAEAGTELTIAATPDDGYEVDAISVKDADNQSVTVTDNKFTMPAKNVTVSVTFKAVPKKGNVNVSEGKEKGNFSAAGLASTADEIKNAVFTDADYAAIAAGKDVNVWVEVKDMSSTVNDADKALIEKKIAGNGTVGTYLDINLLKQVGDNDSEKVTETTNGKIKISFSVPTNLRESGRTYKIVRIHDGVASILDVTVNAEYVLTFETDQFSTYALIYTDQTTAGNGNSAATTSTANTSTSSPKTGDATNNFGWILLMVAGLGVAMIGAKNKKREF